MNRDSARTALQLARALQEASGEARPVPPPAPVPDPVRQFDDIVTDPELRSTSRQLFADGHYAQSVEEAYKFLNNLVKRRSGLETEDGASLMTKAFSVNSPKLKLSKELKSQSSQNQQAGYMRIMEGCMIGIRNPRAHTHAHPDDPRNALELLAFCNHVTRVVRTAIRTRQRKQKKP